MEAYAEDLIYGYISLQNASVTLLMQEPLLLESKMVPLPFLLDYISLVRHGCAGL